MDPKLIECSASMARWRGNRRLKRPRCRPHTGLARAGASVVVTARRQELIDQTAEMVRGYGGKALAVAADITDEAQFEGVFEKAVAEFGRVDILVNNAGYTDRSGLRHDLGSMKRMRSIIDWTGGHHQRLPPGGQRCSPRAAAVGYHVSSILASRQRVPRRLVPRGQGRRDALTRVLAIEYAREGIRVNAIAPSYFDGTGSWTRSSKPRPKTRNYASRARLWAARPARGPRRRNRLPRERRRALRHRPHPLRRWWLDGCGGYHQVPPCGNPSQATRYSSVSTGALIVIALRCSSR